MTNETKRDLHANERDLRADLAICNAASPGPLDTDGYEVFTEYVDTTLDDALIARFKHDDDAIFFVEARTGWPRAIERALAAEKEVARLRRIIDEALKSSEWGVYDDSLRSVVRILKEATADDQR